MEETLLKTCELCEREVESLSKHHLIPREEGGNKGPIAMLCRSCHSTLHHTFTNKTLAVFFNSIEKLKAAEELQAYLKWIKKQRKEKVKIKTKKDRK